MLFIRRRIRFGSNADTVVGRQTRSSIGIVIGCFELDRRAHPRSQMHELSDHLLKDIGMTRDQLCGPAHWNAPRSGDRREQERGGKMWRQDSV